MCIRDRNNGNLLHRERWSERKETDMTEYERWLNYDLDDPDLKEELLSIQDKPEEISDRFYRNLEFGTGGLRGVLGAGTNRMNVYTCLLYTSPFIRAK